MKRKFVPIAKPVELITWLEENDILMNLSEKDVEILMSYMEGHGYQIGIGDTGLLRSDLCADQEDMDDFSIDEIIDAVCEWNYEIIQDTKEASENQENYQDYVQNQVYLDSLRNDEKLLDKMFEQTCYGKEVNDLAAKLADEFICKIRANGQIKCMEAISEDIKEYKTDNRYQISDRERTR